ncbi:MAG: sulfatase [Bryobacteraceae bacterium]|nr:sulfatase [Bryobacteraceae bacterium]
MLSRRKLLQSTPAAALAQTSPPPNIVFLISDDHSVGDLGCYGNRVVTSPHLDRMAREGMRFTHGFVSSSQCSPNRASIFTGCTPHTVGMSRLHAPLPDWEPTVLDQLKERGYFTGIFRKHHQGAGFQQRLDFYGNAQAPFSQFFDALPKNRPFFLQLGFSDPHRPYQDGAFSPPHDPAAVTVPPFLPDTREVRKDLAHYHDFIARMDAECGQLFALLRERGLAGNTVVFMTGDNGMPFPRAKGTCYDIGLRTPLLAWWPGRIAPGTVNSDLIAHVDFAPTWLEIAGLKPAAKMQGKSFLPALLGKPYVPREAVFSERNWHDNFDPIRSVRTRTHKLILNAAPHFPYRPPSDLAASPSWEQMTKLVKSGGLSEEQRLVFTPTRAAIELYDLERDPHEFQNVADDPARRAVKAALMDRLADWMQATADYLPPASAKFDSFKGRAWPVSL